MILYIIKSVCCSAILLGIYHLFFEKEKMHRFNRFYLLFSIVASFCIPLINIEFEQPSQPVEEVITIISTNFSTLSQHTETVVEHYSPMPFILTGIYVLIAFILLFRFTKNLVGLFTKIRHSIVTSFAPARLVLLEEN